MVSARGEHTHTLFIHLTKYLLYSYYMLGTLLCMEATMVSERICFLLSWYLLSVASCDYEE